MPDTKFHPRFHRLMKALRRHSGQWQTNSRWYERRGDKTVRIPDPSKKPLPVATARVHGSTWETNGRHYKHENGKTSRIRNANAKPKTLFSAVKDHGGISASKLGRDWNVQEDFWQAGLGGLFVKEGGSGVDEIADELVARGHLKVPDGYNADDYLMESLKSKALSWQHNYEHEASETELAYQEELKRAYELGGTDEVIGEVTRAGEEEGHRIGESEPLAEGDRGMADEEKGSGEVGGFEFGANEKKEPETIRGVDQFGTNWGEPTAADKARSERLEERLARRTALAPIPQKSGALVPINDIPDPARPEETGFTGRAHNGVYFIDGVAQKKNDQPTKIEEKESANVATPEPDAGVPRSPVDDGRGSPDRASEGTDRGTEGGTGSGDVGRKPDVGATDGAGDGGIAPPEERIVTARADFTKQADPGLVPEVLQQHLRPHQIQGVAAAVASLDKNGGFLLADGTGVGKSREQLATAKIYADRGHKVLIVTRAQVIAPNWKTGEINGSFKSDSEAMGIGLNLVRKTDEIKSGAVSVTTYQNLAEMKKQIDDNTIVLFDESHSLKNYDSAQAKHGAEMAKAAKAVMFNSATPADKPLHIAHMVRARVFGSGKWEDTYRELGMKQREIYIPNLGKTIKKWEIDPRVGAAECARRMDGLFDKMTAEGLMLKREISMKGVKVDFDRIDLPKECHEAMAKIEKDMASSNQPPGLRRAATLMHQRRQQEPYKIPATMAALLKELAEGRQVVIFCSRVNESEATGKTHSGLSEEGEPLTSVKSEGTAKLLAEALAKAGITDYVDLHGGASKKARDKGMADFQSGKAKVAIATIEAAGTGVNLDDTVGDKPRTTLVMTAPFSAVDNMQAAGRTWRLNTKSAPRIRYLFGDTEVDHWNAGLIAGKMKTLGAVAGGEVHALDIPLDLTEEGAADFYEETGGKSGTKQPKYSWPHELTRRTSASGGTAIAEQIKVSGDTYEHKDSIKAAGGRFNDDKTWSVPADKVDAIRHLPGLRFSDKPAAILKPPPVTTPAQPLPSSRPASSYHISGNTFAHKDAIRQAGGKWDGQRKVWIVTPTAKEKLSQLRGLTFTAKNLVRKSLPTPLGKLASVASCPVCRTPATWSCRCRIGSRSCDNGHEWHKCPTHGNVVLGNGHGTGPCSCPVDKALDLTQEEIARLSLEFLERAQLDWMERMARDAVSKGLSESIGSDGGLLPRKRKKKGLASALENVG